MLAALLGVVVVVGAATGFLLTAMQRQVAVVQASALEAQHEALAEIMDDSIKSATDFQIYQATLPNVSSTPFPPGDAAGDYLVCANQDGTRVFHFDGSQIEYQLTVNGATQKRAFTGASRVPKNSQSGAGDPIFIITTVGIVEAQWNVDTTVDRVPFNVFGLPLQMQ